MTSIENTKVFCWLSWVSMWEKWSMRESKMLKTHYRIICKKWVPMQFWWIQTAIFLARNRDFSQKPNAIATFLTFFAYKLQKITIFYCIFAIFIYKCMCIIMRLMRYAIIENKDFIQFLPRFDKIPFLRLITCK